MTCWSAFANKNQESRQFLTCGVTGAEVITNVLFRGASSLQYLTICNVSGTLNNYSSVRFHPYTCRRKRSRYWSRHVHCRTCTLRHPLRCSKSNLWLKAKPGKTHFMFHVSAYFSFLPGVIHCRSDKKAIFSICVCVHYAVSSLAESQLTMTPTSNQCFSSSPAPAARSSFDCRAPPAPPSHRPQTPALQSWRKQVAATMFSVCINNKHTLYRKCWLTKSTLWMDGQYY